MRYLYGDSTPFPYEFDFLLTLGAFMSAATRVVQLEAEAQHQSRELAALAQGRAIGVEAAEQIHQALLLALNQIVPHDTHQAAHDYARKIRDYSARAVQELRGADKGTSDRENAQLAADNERRAGETKHHLDQFFKAAVLPILSSRVSVKLLEGGSRYEIGVVFRNPGEIITSFVLGTARHPAWGTPRRVADFVVGFDLMIGAKKSFFKGVVTPEQVHLDEYVVSRADVHDRGCEIAIKKKLEQKESFVFKVNKTDKGMSGEVDRLDDPNARALSPTLDPQEIAKVDELAQAIRASLAELFGERESVVRVELDGKDIYKNRLSHALVVRLVKTFAPIVEEIAGRSPSQEELSLKLENDRGKREELYLRRADLVKTLQPLNADGRFVFAQLGLDDWVPTLTVRPPDVG
jgi:hypothetical protein